MLHGQSPVPTSPLTPDDYVVIDGDGNEAESKSALNSQIPSINNSISAQAPDNDSQKEEETFDFGWELVEPSPKESEGLHLNSTQLSVEELVVSSAEIKSEAATVHKEFIDSSPKPEVKIRDSVSSIKENLIDDPNNPTKKELVNPSDKSGEKELIHNASSIINEANKTDNGNYEVDFKPIQLPEATSDSSLITPITSKKNSHDEISIVKLCITPQHKAKTDTSSSSSSPNILHSYHEGLSPAVSPSLRNSTPRLMQVLSEKKRDGDRKLSPRDTQDKIITIIPPSSTRYDSFQTASPASLSDHASDSELLKRVRGDHVIEITESPSSLPSQSGDQSPSSEVEENFSCCTQVIKHITQCYASIYQAIRIVMPPRPEDKPRNLRL